VKNFTGGQFSSLWKASDTSLQINFGANKEPLFVDQRAVNNELVSGLDGEVKDSGRTRAAIGRAAEKAKAERIANPEMTEEALQSFYINEVRSSLGLSSSTAEAPPPPSQRQDAGGSQNREINKTLGTEEGQGPQVNEVQVSQEAQALLTELQGMIEDGNTGPEAKKRFGRLMDLKPEMSDQQIALARQMKKNWDAMVAEKNANKKKNKGLQDKIENKEE
jgi:hypothetical protein